MKLRIVFLLLPLAMLLGHPVAAPAAQASLNLDQVLSIALERNPGLAQAEQQVRAAEARVTQAVSAYLPQLSNKAIYNRNWYESEAYAAASGGSGNEFNTYQNTVSVSQYLYDFGATSGQVDQSRYNLSSTQQQRFTTLAQLVQSVSKAYYDVLRKEELVGVNQDSLRVQEAHLEQAKALFESGLKPKIDVTKGEADRAKSRLNLIKAQYDLRTSRVTLEQQLGGPPVEGEYSLAPLSRYPRRPPNQNKLLGEALKARPELADAEAQIQAAEASIVAAQGNYFPSFSLGASYNWQNVEFQIGRASCRERV